jgi:hypothetical protein
MRSSHPRQPASKAIAEAIGQSMIYSIRYPHVFTFIVVGLEKRLSPHNVELILRRSEDDQGQAR